MAWGDHMTRTWMGVFAFFFAVTAHAAQLNLKTISFGSEQVKVSEVSNSRFGAFSEISVAGLQSTAKVGAPKLPVKSFLLQGRPEQITVNLNVVNSMNLENVRPAPVQPQKCRCADQPARAFAFDSNLYAAQPAPYTLTYMGAYRGTPITRLSVPMGSYDSRTNQVTLYKDVQVSTNAVDFSFSGGNYNDYLIIVPDKMAAGVDEFVAYKKSKGFNVEVEKILSPANTLSSLKDVIKKHYDAGTDFVILVGDSSALPMAQVQTSSSNQTPSDLYDFTMDGADDTVPDMFYSRIVASSADQVKAELAKSMDYEKRTSAREFGKIIGVASNQQGQGPADKEYVQSIIDAFKTSLNVSELFLFENDAASNPTTFNAQMNQGAFWMTYVGHGSGTSWPSFYTEYDMSNFSKLNNANVVKPVIIDVACMNGRIESGYLGANAMKVSGNAQGAAAYLGGTVNISWDPPAIMARGIATEQNTKHFSTLGEAILAGQLYLTANWDEKADVVDNFEWYHLQGDPGMNVKF